ncbi:conserved hypothetical protein [Neospora caninum Liverpool]|uniref:Uncharacterized protein n=1 Tax=Neospora caninum (strain Liverpool) TaxID=572307 RepID=F0VLE2_NEOCL|nr:conserved hypothetical protein [Neospora caninum Liverpool]CBZ54070.1 conserved hypothetical protein [Neospora caninum Liverpool]CEL68766.1 TPA: hypothetical protein BN1204_045040 [Neospora caninum Liverpool]|eukprot:XP_003884101.1 conserved hypothetical protein [Neospora caninum Liverpool]
MFFALQLVALLIGGTLLESDHAAAEEHNQLINSSLGLLKTPENAVSSLPKPPAISNNTGSIQDAASSSRDEIVPLQPTAFFHQMNAKATRDLGKKPLFRKVEEPVHLVPIYSSLLGDKYISPFEPPIPVHLPFSGIVVPGIAHLTPKGTRPASVYPASKSGPPLNGRRLEVKNRLKRKGAWDKDITPGAHQIYTSKYYDFEAGEYRPSPRMAHARRLSESEPLASPQTTVPTRILIKDRYTANINPWSVRARAQPPMIFYYPQTATHIVEELEEDQGIERIYAKDLPAVPPPPPCVGLGCYRRLGLKKKPTLFAPPDPVVVVEVTEEKKKAEPKEKKVKISAPPEIRYIPLSKEYIPLLAWPVTHPHPAGSKHGAHGLGGISSHPPQMVGHGDYFYAQHHTGFGGGYTEEPFNASHVAGTGTPMSAARESPATTEYAQSLGSSRSQSEASIPSHIDQEAYAVPDSMGSSMILPYTAAGEGATL